jgi:hypothetical protein
MLCRLSCGGCVKRGGRGKCRVESIDTVDVNAHHLPVKIICTHHLTVLLAREEKTKGPRAHLRT